MHSGKQHHQTVDTTRPLWRGRPRNTRNRDLEKERNVDSGIQVQLEEDGGGSTRQSWMETSGLWSVDFVTPGVTRHKLSKSQRSTLEWSMRRGQAGGKTEGTSTEISSLTKEYITTQAVSIRTLKNHRTIFFFLVANS